jgi:cAMP phosphodiesterase
MRIEILGAHNTETDNTRLPCVLVDDVLVLDAGGLTSSLSLKRQQRVEAVLLTHHHFDHVKDLIMLGANDTVPPSTVDIYGLKETLDIVYKYLLDGRMYKDYTTWPNVANPRFRLKPVAPFERLSLAGCTIIPVPVNHSVPAVGFHVISSGGKSIFYTGDTGSGMENYWEKINPDVIIVEVTGVNRMENTIEKLRHLTPQLLRQELIKFSDLKGCLPRIVATHIPVAYEDEIRTELAEVAKQLRMVIEMGYEGLIIDL